jgi:hypothetical protein
MKKNTTFPEMDHFNNEKIIDVDSLYTEEEQRQIGEEIAKIFMMKKIRGTDRYLLSWGDKTNIGLFRTLVRITEDIINKKNIKA